MLTRDNDWKPCIVNIAALVIIPIVSITIIGRIGFSTNLEIIYLSKIFTTDQRRAAKIDKNIQDISHFVKLLMETSKLLAILPLNLYVAPK
jgi:hypothetical protein